MAQGKLLQKVINHNIIFLAGSFGSCPFAINDAVRQDKVTAAAQQTQRSLHRALWDCHKK
jgi:hypothetical protein